MNSSADDINLAHELLSCSLEANAYVIISPPSALDREIAIQSIGIPILRLSGSATSRPSIMISSRSEEHTSELKSLLRISYAVSCLKKKILMQHTRNNATQY